MSATLTIDATFENGVFVPKRPVRTLPEHQAVQLEVHLTSEVASRPLPDTFFPDESIPAPFDLPRLGESRLVETIRVEAREMDPATIAELLQLQCMYE